MKRMVSRRSLLKAAGLLALSVPVLNGCQPAAPAAPAAGATTAPKAEAPKASVAKPKITCAVWTIGGRTWQREGAEEYVQMHPEIDITIDDVVYDDMSKKQLTGLATDTLQDIVYSGVKWYGYSAYKGAFLNLDELIKSNNTDMSDYNAYALEGVKIDDKFFGTPFELNPGNLACVFYNKDILADKGVAEPTDDWSWPEYAEMAAKLTDAQNHVYGANYLPTNYYDVVALCRSWGSEILSEDGKSFILHTDPMAIESAKTAVDLRTVYKAAAMRADAQGLAFDAGQVVLHSASIQGYGNIRTTVADKFAWDAVLWPKGPTGLRGYDAFISIWSIYSKTKEPDEAFKMMQHLLNPELQQRAFVEQGQPPSRSSVLNSKESADASPLFPRYAAWMTDGVNKGKFPMPWNFRFSELQDKFGNLIPPVWYGEVPFEQGLTEVGEACDAICKLDRG